MKDLNPRRGEVIMLLDKDEMLRAMNIYLVYVLHEKELPQVEAVDVKPYRYGEKKQTYYSVKLAKKNEGNPSN